LRYRIPNNYLNISIWEVHINRKNIKEKQKVPEQSL